MEKAAAIDLSSHLSQQALRREQERGVGDFGSGIERPSVSFRCILRLNKLLTSTRFTSCA